MPKHLRGLSQRRAENIKHSNSLTRIPACLSMPRRSCQHLIPMVLKRADKGEEQKYRYIQYVPRLGIDGEIEAGGKNRKRRRRHEVGDKGESKGTEGQKKGGKNKREMRT